MVSYPGGKGVNVARIVHQLNAAVIATGFVGGHNGEYIREALTRQGISHDFVTVEGESRLCLNVLHDGGISTELLEPGPPVTFEALEALERTVTSYAARSSVVILSGSAPIGVPSNWYARMIASIQGAGAQAFLDASGTLLQEGVAAHPDFIKPNESEIGALLDRTARDESDFVAAVRMLVNRGIGCVALTLGAGGAIVGVKGAAYRVRVPPLPVVSAVGCGDAFVAGMAVGFLRGLAVPERVRLAAAAACANALHREAGRIEAPELQRLLPLIDITLC
jgi:tagatose 6-phosphate kinase